MINPIISGINIENSGITVVPIIVTWPVVSGFKFNVEIITDSKVNGFNFEQTSKSISFEVNEKNKFVTINMEEKLLGGPYVILLDNEKIEFSQYSIKENYISLAMKPESSGEIMIIGTTVIPEFSMFIPLIMGFMIILTVPLMKKFSLR